MKLDDVLLIFIKIVQWLRPINIMLSLRQNVMTLATHLKLILLARRLIVDGSKGAFRLVSSLLVVVGDGLHLEHLLALDVVLRIILVLLNGIIPFMMLDTPFRGVVT